MFPARGFFSLPLLMKELLEQAARTRTYIYRMLYVILLCISVYVLLDLRYQNLNPLTVLGTGDVLLKQLVFLELIGIALFLPAMACGSISNEKQDNKLGLLFLTRLGPWTILFEKLLSSLLPMVCLLLCALPVVAFANALGGISTNNLISALWFPLLLLIQLGSIAVMSSAIAASSTAAFIWTYIFFGLSLLQFYLEGLQFWPSLAQRADVLAAALAARLQLPRLLFDGSLFLSVFSPIQLFFETQQLTSGPVTPIQFSLILFAISVPSLASAGLCLCVARLFLYRNATRKSRHPFKWLMNRYDRSMRILSTWGRVRQIDVYDPVNWPGTQPLVWRSQNQGLLNQRDNWIRLQILVNLPLAFILAVILIDGTAAEARMNVAGLITLLFCLWAIPFLMTLVRGTHLFPRERAAQSLSVLLATPISSRDMILQASSGIAAMQLFWAVPLICATLAQTWQRELLTQAHLSQFMMAEGYYWWEYLLSNIAAVLLFFPLAKWISVWCGLICRTSIRALLLGITIAVAYNVIPLLALFYIEREVMRANLHDAAIKWPIMFCLNLSPALFLMGNEGFARIRFVCEYPLVITFFTLVIQGAILFGVRRHVLRHADWYLGRSAV